MNQLLFSVCIWLLMFIFCLHVHCFRYSSSILTRYSAKNLNTCSVDILAQPWQRFYTAAHVRRYSPTSVCVYGVQNMTRSGTIWESDINISAKVVVFSLYVLSFCLSVSRITQKVVDKFLTIFGWVEFLIINIWQDFWDHTEHDAEQEFLQEFLPLRDGVIERNLLITQEVVDEFLRFFWGLGYPISY